MIVTFLILYVFFYTYKILRIKTTAKNVRSLKDFLYRGNIFLIIFATYHIIN